MVSHGDARTICPGCCSTKTEQVESVSAEDLASAWVESRSHDVDDETVRAYVLADLGTERIEFWLCRDCGLEFAQPMNSWTNEHYPAEKHSLGYDHQLALEELATMPRLRILEIGCADGQFLEKASLMGHETTGIDFSEEDVNSARALGVDAYVGDIEDVGKLVSGKFDLFALFQVIEHLREPAKVFSEILEIAEPGAIVMVGCPSHLRYSRLYNHPERIERSDFWDYPPQHLLRWTSESLVTFLERFKFQTERIAFEPLSIIGATAHLTALQGLRSNWYGKRWRRRSATLAWLARLTADRLAQRSTGIRLFVKARLRS
jgi:SAM-dependent methyltransferase